SRSLAGPGPSGTRRTDPRRPASSSERRVRLPGRVRDNGAPRPAPLLRDPSRTRPVLRRPYVTTETPAAHPRRPGRTTLFRETAPALDPPPPPPAALPAARGGRDRPPARDHPRDPLPAQPQRGHHRQRRGHRRHRLHLAC